MPPQFEEVIKYSDLLYPKNLLPYACYHTLYRCAWRHDYSIPVQFRFRQMADNGVWSIYGAV